MKAVWRTLLPLIAAATVALATTGTVSARATRHLSPADNPGGPHRMAALGDSLSAAWASPGAPYSDPTASWSTGTKTAVASHFARLVARQPLAGWDAVNLAVPGAKAADLAKQAAQVPLGTSYITITIGISNVCVASVTSPGRIVTQKIFATGVRAALDILAADRPHARILVASIPDVYSIWSRLHGDPDLTAAWRRPGTCPLVFGPAATPATREAVRFATIGFNLALEERCRKFTMCRYDNGATYDLKFGKADLSTYDGLHLSIAGQARLAKATWNAGWFRTRRTARKGSSGNTCRSGTVELHDQAGPSCRPGRPPRPGTTTR